MDLIRLFHGSKGFRPLVALFLSLGFLPYLRAFQLPLNVQSHENGKEVVVKADSQQRNGDTYHLRGHVEITYEDMHVTADEASMDSVSGDVMAHGNVVFDDATSHLTADEVHYNVLTKKGWFSNGVGYLHAKTGNRPRVLRTENPFYIWGDTVDRLSDNTYLIDNGRMTTCDCAKHGWLISARQARIVVDDKAVAHDVVFRFLGIPIFYFPVVVDSIARQPRQTGFLLPHVGTSSQKGFIVGDGFFWAINPSTDLLLGAEEYSERGLAERGQFRIKPSEDASFIVDYFGINDKYSNVALRAPGKSIHAFGKDDDIGDGFRAVANVDYVNDMAFRLTWSGSYSEAVSSEAVQSGFVSKNWNGYSFNVSAERYEDFLSTQIIPGNYVIIRHLPSVQLTDDDKQLGDSPIYFSFDTSADALGRSAPGLSLPLLGERVDFHPQFMLRPKEFWHFRFTPSLGFRATDYSLSLLPNHGALDRLLLEVGFDLRPPSLEKVFDRSVHGYRIKHVIEPDIQYHLVHAHDPENILDVVRFDALDILTETNEVEYSLTNSLLGRKDVSGDSSDTPQARDIFSWRLSQKYYFDPTFGGALVPGQTNVFASTIDLTGFAFEHGQSLSPIDSVFKFAPFSNCDTELRTDVSPTGTGGILDAGITSHVKKGLLEFWATDFFVNHSSYLGTLLNSTSTTGSSTTGATTPTPLTAFNLLSTLMTYGDSNRKGLSGAFGMDYNFQQKINQHIISRASYNFGCFAIDMEYQYFNLGPLRHENQFRVALSLANVGTFGNLKARELTF